MDYNYRNKLKAATLLAGISLDIIIRFCNL